MVKTSFATEYTLEKMERLYSRKYGLANVVNINHNTPAVGLKGHYDCTIGNIIPIYSSGIYASGSENPSGIMMGGAVSRNIDKSLIKAFGEFMERQRCSLDELSTPILFDSYDNLANKGYACLDLRELIPFEDHLYDDPSFPWPRYDTCHNIYWIQGVELISGAEFWLPLQKVVLSFSKPRNEIVYISRLSTGHACGSSFQQAAVGAMHEVIERDSFMLTWHLKIPGVRIEIDHCQNNGLAELYAHMCKYLTGEDKLYVFDISKTEGVYTILSFIKNDLPSAYGIIVSAASHPDPETAVLKALEELCQCQHFAYHNLLGERGAEYQQMEIKDIDNLHKHFFYYSTGTRSKNIDFIFEGNKRISLSKMPSFANGTYESNLAYLTHLFNQRKQPVYLADVTKNEIRGDGYYVLKCVIPGYLDLEVTQQYRQLKYSRLQRYSKELGRSINHNPHPFP